MTVKRLECPTNTYVRETPYMSVKRLICPTITLNVSQTLYMPVKRLKCHTNAFCNPQTPLYNRETP